MLASGTVLNGKYRVESLLGSGGMGSVWRATRLDLGTAVALKVMHMESSRTPEGVARFNREARAAASLSSPHVVRIIDFGVDAATELPFIVMELLLGETLDQRLKRCQKLPVAAVSAAITQVARALGQAHGAGLVHRDLKPANIF